MFKYIKLAWRNMWRNWRRTAIALIAIVLGLVLLLLMDGMIKGSDQAIFGNAVRLYGGNIQVHAPGFVEKASRLPLLPLDDAGRSGGGSDGAAEGGDRGQAHQHRRHDQQPRGRLSGDHHRHRAVRGGARRASRRKTSSTGAIWRRGPGRGLHRQGAGRPAGRRRGRPGDAAGPARSTSRCASAR